MLVPDDKSDASHQIRNRHHIQDAVIKSPADLVLTFVDVALRTGLAHGALGIRNPCRAQDQEHPRH